MGKVRGTTKGCPYAKWDVQVLVRPRGLGPQGFHTSLVVHGTPAANPGDDASDGSVRYRRLAQATYTLTLTHDAPQLWAPFVAETLTLGLGGGKRTHRFQPQPLHTRVAPVVTLAAPATPVGGAVKLRLSIDQTGDAVPFGGAGKLTVNADHVALFRDEGLTAAFPLASRSATVSNGELLAGLDLWARGESAGEVEVTLTLDALGQGDLARRHTELGDPATVSIAVLPNLELFRDATVLDVVPFATSDLATSLDNPIPGDKHFDSTYTRPASFDYPRNTDYGPHALADADTSIFRVRLKDLPAGIGDGDIDALIKVTTSAGDDIVGTSGFKFNGTAVKAPGLAIKLKKNVDAWESPYLRVATTVDALSKNGTSAIVHSPAPVYSVPTADRDPVQGEQYGRLMKVSCTVAGHPVEATFTMGGRPYAKVPVRFTWIADGPPPDRLLKTSLDRIADANAYWAGHGLTFELQDPTALDIPHVSGPDRNLLVIGEHTGHATVSDHDFDVAIRVAVTVGGTTYPRPPLPRTAHMHRLDGLGDAPLEITATIPANSTPAAAAAEIKQAIEAWTPALVALTGLKLGADVFDFTDPRVVLGVDPSGAALPLTAIGAHGPTDITIKRASGPAVEKLEIVGVAATALGAPDPTVDLFAPPLLRAFHDPNVNPASAAQRGWVRAFGSSTGDYVSVLVAPREDVQERRVAALNEAGLSTLYDADEGTLLGRIDASLRVLGSSTSPISILNFDRWTETCARFLVFLPSGSFTPSNDFAHELGHTFADCNHTPKEPKWFYSSELMHPSGPQAPNAKANKMTRHAIQVDTAVNEAGWKSKFITLASGYGGAARARIARLAGGWLDTSGGPGFPWP
ncbi:MAG: hypothetical protein H6719_18390 [Sandaracinaceae bacterium]|nr:hypothetical protein [Sandaracinaceae bacterium]